MFFIILSVYLNLLSGDVKIKSDGIWKDGLPEMELKNGDTITVIDGKAEIVYDEFNIIVVDSGTTIGINYDDNSSRIYLSVGRIWSKITKLFSGKIFEVENPVCIAGVRGTEFLVSYSQDSSDIEVLDGEVEVKEKSMNKMIILKRLERIRMRRKFIGKIQKIDEKRFIHWYRWERRDAERILEKIKARRERREELLERLEILQRRLKDKEIEKRINELNEEGMKDEELIKIKVNFFKNRIEENISQLKLKIQELENIKDEIKSDFQRFKYLIKKREFKEAKALLFKIENKVFILKVKGKEIFIISEKIRINKEKLQNTLEKIKDKNLTKELTKNLKNTLNNTEKLLNKIKRLKEEHKLLEKMLEEIKKKI